MFSDLGWLGILTCVYALARLIHYASLRLDDSGKHPIVNKFLTLLCFILWLLSAPVTIVMGIINMMHYHRLEDKIKKDLDEDPSSHNYHKDSLIPIEIIAVVLFVLLLVCTFQNSDLRNKIESLDAQIEELEHEYDRGYEEGCIDSEAKAYNEGYDDGYSAGADISWEDSYLDGYNDGYAEGCANSSTSAP